MFKAIHSRLNRENKGFTLIELMVVVLIIAILIAIAIPTFLGARKKAQDRAAQADLRQGLLTAKSYYTDTESFVLTSTALTAPEYEALEPSLDFDGGAMAAGTTKVWIADATATTVLLVKESKSGTWFGVSDSTAGPTTYCNGADETAAVFASAAACVGGW